MLLLGTIQTNYDFEDPRLDVWGFIIDYFCWRAEQDKVEWFDHPEFSYGTQPEHVALRQAAAVFERRRIAELNRLTTMLIEEENQSYQRFCDLLEEFGRIDSEGPLGMSYARLVGVLTFSGMVVSRMLQKGMRKNIQGIALYTSRFIDSRIRTQWPTDLRSWSGFLRFADDLAQRDQKKRLAEQSVKYTRWSYYIGAAIVGIGAVAGARLLLAR